MTFNYGSTKKGYGSASAELGQTISPSKLSSDCCCCVDWKLCEPEVEAVVATPLLTKLPPPPKSAGPPPPPNSKLAGSNMSCCCCCWPSSLTMSASGEMVVEK